MFAQVDVFDAARKGDLETIKSLYAKDASILNSNNAQDYTPLILATYYNQVKVVEFLLDNDVSLNTEQGSATALQASCFKGYKEITKLLLEYGADPNTYDPNGTSPLIYATQFKHVEIIKLLLAKKANKSFKDLSGNNAVDYAEKLQIKEAISLFNQ